jgi:trehalose 6-phosphate phosphatase
MLRAVAATADFLLERFSSEPGQAGLFLDFDGVLAPIVDRPDDAAAPPETRTELRRLADRYGLVAVVSGRTSADVRTRVGVDGIRYVGSHGLELDPQAEQWRETLAAFAADAPWPTAQVEPKGLSVSFHYRDRPDEREAVLELEEIADAARAEGLVARFGRKILELLPPTGSNKGTAIRHLLEETRLERALVAGDDTTDLDSFRAVDGLECSVRVAVVSPESPSLLADEADVTVESTVEFLELLRRL